MFLITPFFLFHQLLILLLCFLQQFCSSQSRFSSFTLHWEKGEITLTWVHDEKAPRAGAFCGLIGWSVMIEWGMTLARQLALDDCEDGTSIGAQCCCRRIRKPEFSLPTLLGCSGKTFRILERALLIILESRLGIIVFQNCEKYVYFTCGTCLWHSLTAVLPGGENNTSFFLP